MKKLSFEKFGSKKVKATQINKLIGGFGEATDGGSVELENYMGQGNATLAWTSDSTGPGGGITYYGESITFH